MNPINIKKVEDVKKALKTPKTLKISRIPPKTLLAFLELANEEFCGDYGMTLKWILEMVGYWIPKFQELNARVDNIESTLNGKTTKKNDESITMLNGRVIKKFRGE